MTTNTAAARRTVCKEKATNDKYNESLPSSFHFDIDQNAKWIQEGVTVAGGNGKGSGFNQLSFPFGLRVDDDETVYVTDLENDRIMEWKLGATSGRLVAGGNGEGHRPDQLNGPADVVIDKATDSLIICDWLNRRVVRWPRLDGSNGETIISDVQCRGLAIDNEGFLYFSNWGKNEVTLCQVNGTLEATAAGGNGEGSRLDQFSFPGYICIGPDDSVYASDWNNHRVMKWMKGAKEGIIVAGGQGKGNALSQLAYPFGVIVDRFGTVYVVDSRNHRIMRWPQGASEGTIIVGGNGEGDQTNQLKAPVGLAFDQHGHLYVSDAKNHRIQRFDINRAK